MVIKEGGEKLLRWRRLLVATVIVIPLIWLLAYGFTRDARYIQSPLIGRQAPEFTLALFDGNNISLKDLRGKAVLVNFWASWCLECRVEAPGLEAAWRKHRGENVVFLGVNIQDKEEEARTFIKEFGLTYVNGRDPRQRIAVNYGVWGIPETFFLDPEGRITYKHVGAIEPGTITAKINEALRGIVSAGEGRGNYQSVQ